MLSNSLHLINCSPRTIRYEELLYVSTYRSISDTTSSVQFTSLAIPSPIILNIPTTPRFFFSWQPCSAISASYASRKTQSRATIICVAYIWSFELSVLANDSFNGWWCNRNIILQTNNACENIGTVFTASSSMRCTLVSARCVLIAGFSSKRQLT